MFRGIADSAPDAIFLVGRDCTVLVANTEAHRVFGYKVGALVGTPLERLIPGAVRRVDAVFREASRRRMDESLNLTASRKDGSTFPVEISLGPFDRRGSSAALIVVRDVTERRTLEAALIRTEMELRHFQKVEAIGALAGGVAHDFNNLLSVILSYSGLLLGALGPDHPLQPDVREIQKAGERAGELTRQLLAFSRRQIVKPIMLDVDHSLEGMERMLRRLLDADCELSIFCGAEGGALLAVPAQIEQIVMNLIVNARDAMPHGGEVTIRTSNAKLGLPGRENQYVKLEITDTGVGMDQGTRERIFEPYFTTKAPGEGTGLGLSTVHRIVRQMAGHITVRSEPGRGTTFTMFFPTAGAAPAGGRAVPQPVSTLAGSETVLLVEDDDAVRQIVRAILERSGYLVLSAQNGGEAFLTCERHEHPIDVLLTDVVMPRMNGFELWARLAPMRPEMKVLFMSGYSETAVLERTGEVSVGFFQKPVTPATLLAKVREVLGN